MKTAIELKTEIERIFGRENYLPEVFLGAFEDGLYEVCKNFSRGKIEVVMAEKDFKKVGSTILEKIKSFGVGVQLLLIEDRDFSYSAVKSSFNGSFGCCIAVGDKYLLSAVRYYSSLNGTPCYAIPITPCFDKVLAPNVYLKTKALTAEMPAEKFKKVIIDENLILKSRSESFAEAYASSVSKLMGLIDYKLNCFLNGTAVDERFFTAVKQGINLALGSTSCENAKQAIIASQAVLAIATGKSDALLYTGAECIKTALSVYAHEAKDCKKEFISFEKTLKLYHLFFSNDFSDLLSVPDYYVDTEALEKDFKRDRAFFIKNVKIPSEKRRRLISLLLLKTSSDFKAETTAIMRALTGIKRVYVSMLGVQGDGNISYKQIKNSVTASTYLTDRVTALTLMRDLGVLQCAN
ncbi:MAG: hypothetical protein IJA97_02680 [Clostridia bacterium]|nr:hypothetical protein [Clostridia bacterium]